MWATNDSILNYLESFHERKSSTLAWEIPWMEGPSRLQAMGSRRVRHDWVTSLSLFTFMHWRRKWQPTPVFLPGESQGQEPGGVSSMGSERVRHDWRDLAAAAWEKKEKFIKWFSYWMHKPINICKFAAILLKYLPFSDIFSFSWWDFHLQPLGRERINA